MYPYKKYQAIFYKIWTSQLLQLTSKNIFLAYIIPRNPIFYYKKALVQIAPGV